MNDPSPLIALSRWRAPPGERSDHYLNSLALAGGRVLCLQPDPEVDPPSAEELAAVAGLVLSGGKDIDPRLYGQRRHPEMAETMTPLFSAFVQACRQGR